MTDNLTILCLVNFNYTLSRPKDDSGIKLRHWARPGYMLKMHPLCFNPGVPFWMHKKTHQFRARYQASSIRADVTVVLGMRQTTNISAFQANSTYTSLLQNMRTNQMLFIEQILKFTVGTTSFSAPIILRDVTGTLALLSNLFSKPITYIIW